MVEDMLEPVSVVDIDGLGSDRVSETEDEVKGTIEADSKRVQAMVEDMPEPTSEVDYDGAGFDRDSEVEKVGTTLRLVEEALDEVDGTIEADSERFQATAVDTVVDTLEPVSEFDNDGTGFNRASETEQVGTTLTEGTLDAVKDMIETDSMLVQVMMEDMLEPVSGVDGGLDRDSETEEVGTTPKLPTAPHTVEVAKQEGATESEVELGEQQRLGSVIKANQEASSRVVAARAARRAQWPLATYVLVGEALEAPVGAAEAQVEGCSEMPSAAAQEVQGLDEATVALIESRYQRATATGFGGVEWDSFAPRMATLKLLAAARSEG
ncbi:unnamed protein product [Prorocentrum cordatum]|uniref:Uncharacterized protein n=1 Tax=Prorocentrum cordatum TaxID=2364126 RepID=A0ABN9XJP7_9DINO|nr:unnamed protein product [Polarella glacialis]